MWEPVAFVDRGTEEEPTEEGPASKRLRENSPAPTEIDPETQPNADDDMVPDTLPPPGESRPPEIGIKNDLAEECPLLAMWEAGPVRDHDPLGWNANPGPSPPSPVVQDNKQVPQAPAPMELQWQVSAKLDDLDEVMAEASTFADQITHDVVKQIESKTLRIDFRHFGKHRYASLIESVQRLLSSGVSDCYIGLARDVWHRWCKMSNTKSRHHLRWQSMCVFCCTGATHARWCERR